MDAIEKKKHPIELSLNLQRTRNTILNKNVFKFNLILKTYFFVLYFLIILLFLQLIILIKLIKIYSLIDLTNNIYLQVKFSLLKIIYFIW